VVALVVVGLVTLFTLTDVLTLGFVNAVFSTIGKGGKEGSESVWSGFTVGSASEFMGKITSSKLRLSKDPAIPCTTYRLNCFKKISKTQNH